MKETVREERAKTQSRTEHAGGERNLQEDTGTGAEDMKAPAEKAAADLRVREDAGEKAVPEDLPYTVIREQEVSQNPALQSLVQEVAKDLLAAGVASGIHEGGKFVLQIPAAYVKHLSGAGDDAASGKAAEEVLSHLLAQPGAGGTELVPGAMSSEEMALSLLSVQNVLMSFQNLLLGEEIYQVSMQIREVAETADRIARGQQSDRYGKLLAGRTRLTAALKMEGEDQKRELDSAISLIAEGQQQIFLAMKDEIEHFRPVPESGAARSLAQLLSPGYFDAKDAAFAASQSMYAGYLLATKLLALSYTAAGHREIGESVFREAGEDLDRIDYTNIRTIGEIHPEQMKKAFFNRYEENLRYEERKLREEGKVICVELSGKDLQEAAGKAEESGKLTGRGADPKHPEKTV